MKLAVHEHDRKPDEAFRTALADAVSEKLSRISPRVRSVAVSIRDLNGPRGGIDQEVRVVAELVTGRKIVVRHRSANVTHDIAATIRRVVRAARSELARRRTRLRGERRNRDEVLAA